MGEITELDTARTTTKHKRNTLFPWENDKRYHKNNTEKNSFVTLVQTRLHLRMLRLSVLKLCDKNSSGNVRFKIFVAGFRAQKLFGTFAKWAPGMSVH